MELDQHYVDSRLVALYDLDNLRGKDTDFYIRLADSLEAQRIIDLGCGTGLLTRELAASLVKAGFNIQQVFGDWDSGPVVPDSQSLIFVAQR